MAGQKKKDLTVTLYVGGRQINELTTHQIEKLKEKLEKKISTYYSLHLEEYTRI